MLVDDELQGGRGYPRPQLQRNDWTSLNGEWEFATRPATRVAAADAGRLGRAASSCRSLRRRRRAASPTTGFFRACWYRRTLRRRPSEPGDDCLLSISAPSTMPRRSGATAGWRRATRAATRRSASTSRRFSRGDGQRARSSSRADDDPLRSREAARQAGLAARAALDLVSAHHRHLADRLDSRSCRRRASAPAALDAESRALGDRLRGVGRRRDRRQRLRLHVHLTRRRHGCSRTTPSR